MEFMKLLSLALAYSLVWLALVAVPSQAQDSPQDYVNAHNVARTQFGAGPMVWDDKVAAYAQNYAKTRAGDCKLVHSSGPYGENLAWASWDLTGVEAVKFWVDEKADYDYKSNTCAPGKTCGHYTQVVWHKSVRLGCAKVKCGNNNGTLITCNYDPPGNVVDSYTETQSKRDMAVPEAQWCVVSLHIPGPTCSVDVCNAARIKEYGTKAKGECFYLIKPNDTCRCDIPPPSKAN